MHSLLDLVKSYRDIRQLLMSWVDTKSIGNLSQVSRDFRLFGDERIIWIERLRRVFNITPTPDQHPKEIYLRLKSEYAELTAYLKQFCIYKLLISNAEFNEVIMKLNNSCLDNTWQPLTHTELLELMIKHGGTQQEFENLSQLIDNIAWEQMIFATPKWGILLEKAYETEFTMLGKSMSLAYDSKNDSLKSYIELQDIPADTKPLILGLCLIGVAFILTPVFFTRRGYTEALTTFLDRLDKNQFPDIHSEVRNPDIQVDYAEEMFKKALGHLCIVTTAVMMQEPIKPSAKLVEYLINRNASCVRARDTASRTIKLAADDTHGYTSINHNPLWMTIESINVVNENICKNQETALDYLRELEKIALMLIDNGEDKMKAFMPNINPALSLSPSIKIHEMLEMIERDVKQGKELSIIDIERKRILENILTYQPALKPVNDEYVDTFPYYKP